MRKVKQINPRKKKVPAVSTRKKRSRPPGHNPFQKAITRASIVSMADKRGSITYVNDNFVSISGYSREELIGKNHHIINSGYHGKSFWADMWGTISRGSTWRAEVKNRAKDGSYYWVDTFIMPFVDKKGNVTEFLSIRNDITDRKKSEEQLIQSNATLRETLVFGKIGHAELDLETFQITVSRELFQLLDVHNEQEQALSLDRFLSAYVDANYLETIRTKIEEGANLSGQSRKDVMLEFEMITATGRKIWIEAKGIFREGKAFGLLQDITEQKRSELQAAVNAQEAKRLALIASRTSNAVVLTDVDGRITWVNDGFVRITEFTREEAIGHKPGDLLQGPETSHDTIRQMRTALKREEGFKVEILNYTKSGKSYWLDIETMPVKNEAGKLTGFMAIQSDITSLKNALKEMQKSEQTLQAFMDHAPMHAFIRDLDGRYVFYNKAYQDLIADALSQHGVKDFNSVHDEMTKLRNSRDQLVIANGKAMQFEYDLYGKNLLEYKFPLRDSGEVITGVGSISLDITEKLQARKLLAENAERLQSITDHLSDGVIYQYIVNEHGRVESFPYVSSGAYELFEIPADSIMKNPWAFFRIIHPHDLSVMRKRSEVSRKELIPFDFEYRITTPGGKTKWMHTRSSPKRLPDGKTIWNGLTTNTTTRKKLELALQDNEMRLQSIFHNMISGVVVVDVNGEITYANQSASKILALQRHKIERRLYSSKTWKQIGENGESYPVSKLPLATALERKKAVLNMEHGIIVGDDEVKWLNVSAAPLLDQDQNLQGAVANFFDITARRNAQRELLKVYDELNAVLNASTDSTFFIDSQYNIQLYNRTAEEYFWKVYRKNVTKGSSILDYVRPENIERFKSRFEHSLKGESFSFEKEIVNVGGRYWFQVRYLPVYNKQGSIIGVSCNATDITLKRSTEEELRHTSSRLKLATQASNMGVWEWNLKIQQLICDEKLYELFGYSRTTPLTMDMLTARVNEEDLAHIERSVRGLSPDQNIACYKFRITPGNTQETRYIRSFIIAEFDEDNSVTKITGADYDVTEQEQAERLLRESEERFRAMADSAPVLIWMSGKDKLCNYFNKGWLDFTGRTMEQEMGNGWADGVHPDDLDRCIQIYSTYFDEQKEFSMEYRLRRKDGQYRWIIDQGKPRYLSDGQFIGYIGSCFDIHDRWEAQQKLVESEKRFNTFMQHTPVCNWITDLSGKINYGNEAYLSRFNLTRETAVEKNIEELYAADIASQFKTDLQNVSKNNEGMQTIELWPHTGGGYTNEFLVYKFPMGNNLIGGVAVDISKQQNAERELLKSLAEKDILIKEIHHRVKNNLQLISSILYIRMSQMQESEIKDFLESMRQKIRSIALIHERLLQTGSVNRVDISEYLGKLIKDLQMSNNRPGLAITFESNIESDFMNLDRAICCGLIINELVVNSVKHAFVDRTSGVIRIALEKRGNGYQMVVENDGLSLSEEISPGKSGSFGMQLLDIFIKQLNGGLIIRRGNGTTYSIYFT